MPGYDADANRDLILSIILGDVDPTVLEQAGIEILLTSRYDTFRSELLLGVTVRVTKVDYICREVLDTKALFQSHLDLEQQVWKVFLGIARKLSFKLFEQDPRIGLPLTDMFPDCPLFDPPYIKHPYQTYLGRGTKSHLQGNKAFDEAWMILSTCPFCRGRLFKDPETGISPGVWCGGNVGFAHGTCAPWVNPRH